MTLLSDAERDLVDDLLECIAIAIDRTEGVDREYANKTKLQKLLYLAIDEFDLPITYSWYLAGAVLPDDAATPQTLATSFDQMATPDQPEMSLRDSVAVSEVESPESDESEGDEDEEDDTEFDDEAGVHSEVDPVLFSAPSASPSIDAPTNDGYIDGHPREEIVDFYTAELPNVWKQGTMRFLQNFYLEHAPSEYRDLYVQSTHLRIRLRTISETIEEYLNGESPSESIADQAKAVGHDISELHGSIHSSDALATTFEGVVAGTDIIEDALMMLAQQPPEDLTESHRDAVAAIEEFYYYYVWRYPCLIISEETARGPSAPALREARQNRLSDFEEELQDQITELSGQLADVGLQPTYADYPADSDEVGTAIGELATQYFTQ